MTLTDAMMMEQRGSYTENGAFAHNTTGSALLDLFAMAGAMRASDANRIRPLFIRAFVENHELALKLAFYARDIRGGLGERKTARTLFRILARQWPDYLNANLKWIPEYGRWDDLLICFDTPLEADMISLIQAQLNQDLSNMLEGKPVSLLAKWMPGVNASSGKTRKAGKRLARALGMDERTYRNVLSQLRSYLNVTEKNLSMDTMDCIRYSEVPSMAMNRYRSAFFRKDADRFSEYLSAVKKGTAAIHSDTLFPYDITEKYLYSASGYNEVLETQWKALPDYVGEESRFLVMADVSGSMYGRPLATSVGLAIYFAQRSKGPFHNRFMTFSARPELVEICGRSLYEQINYVQNADWGFNTNLYSAFELILKTAVKNQTPAEEMPTSLVIITDMEIDDCTCGRDILFTDLMKERFEACGYALPNLVFWNVSARHSTFHASMDCSGVQLASGQSASMFASLTKGVYLSPYEYMVQTLSVSRYDRIICPDDPDPAQ